ncbi:hypothetical protein CHCC5027_1839 [Bacillus paralicheniformis]|nr:hypothetical protein CHCC5027_1839 [Bacillus paralicheniformis]TWK38258.1 hypothetical protein CHCC20348_3670 [Bacillus paralicheniformis]
MGGFFHASVAGLTCILTGLIRGEKRKFFKKHGLKQKG